MAGCRPRSRAPNGRVGKRHRCGWGKMSSCRWEGQELRDERCYSETENAERPTSNIQRPVADAAVVRLRAATARQGDPGYNDSCRGV
jgi:hypothetical protein